MELDVDAGNLAAGRGTQVRQFTTKVLLARRQCQLDGRVEACDNNPV